MFQTTITASWLVVVASYMVTLVAGNYKY